jgi:hypothetical protein
MRDDVTFDFTRTMIAAFVFGVGVGIIWRLTGFAALFLIPLCMFPVRRSPGPWASSFTIDVPYLWRRPSSQADLVEWRKHRRIFGLVLSIAVITRLLLVAIV